MTSKETKPASKSADAVKMVLYEARNGDTLRISESSMHKASRVLAALSSAALSSASASSRVMPVTFCGGGGAGGGGGEQAKEKEEKALRLECVADGVVLRKLADYCLYHQHDGEDEKRKSASIAKPLKSAIMVELVGAWDAQFVNVEQSLLSKLLIAANGLNMASLFELVAAKLATLVMSNGSPDKLRKAFYIPDSLSKTERVVVERENNWTQV